MTRPTKWTARLLVVAGLTCIYGGIVLWNLALNPPLALSLDLPLPLDFSLDLPLVPLAIFLMASGSLVAYIAYKALFHYSPITTNNLGALLGFFAFGWISGFTRPLEDQAWNGLGRFFWLAVPIIAGFVIYKVLTTGKS